MRDAPEASPMAFGRALVARLGQDDSMGLAAELAYRFLFALFPFAIFVAALGGFAASWLGLDDPSGQILETIGSSLPADLAGPVKSQLDAVLTGTHPELLSVGALLTIWAAGGGISSLTKAMNRFYDVRETRPLPVRTALASLLTGIAGLGLMVAFVAIVGAELLTQRLIDRLGWGAVWPALSWLRWPAVFVILVVAIAAVLRFAPNYRPAWRWTLAGAAGFAVGWLAMTFGLGLYVSQWGSFDATYGALAGVIVLLFWFYMSAFILVAAGEFVALLVLSYDCESICRRRAETGSECRMP